MRAMQFWILLLGSTVVSVLMIKQISLSRSLHQEQALLAESQDTFALGSRYENAWKQLALHIYQSSPNDPALAQVLKDQKIEIHSTPVQVPGAPSTPGAATAPANSSAAPFSSKAENTPPHP